ncbi:uncharacterized protein [Montipora capricornis]|uniref:uncharacterized protein n=1 Tax=Montipora capricornis TaxID=246305 RepID=UPI0035F140BF
MYLFKSTLALIMPVVRPKIGIEVLKKGKETMRRNRGNFPSKGNSGMCRIRGCPQIGKSLKRLDNHLSRYHKGVTRAMNDRQSLNVSHSNKSYVTCLLPHCGKDVLHLSHNLRNKHSNMKVNEYYSTVRKTYQSERTERLEKRQSKMVTMKEEKREIAEKEKTIVAKYSPSEVLPADSDPVVITSESNLKVYNKKADEGERDEEIDEGYANDIQEEDESTVKSGKTVAQFSRSRLCRVVLGEMHLSTLQCIYRYRKYLTSYYRLERYHPYPEKEMIHSCVACAATERGKYSCPILPKSFYVFCRQKCLIDWNCDKCVNFDRGPSHACFDFFHCAICHERYVASTRHSPYPPENWGRRSFSNNTITIT